MEIYTGNFGSYLNTKAGLSNHKFGSDDFVISVELDNVKKVEGNNVLLIQEVCDKCGDLVKKNLPKLIKELQKLDKIAKEGDRTKAINSEIENFNSQIADEMIEAARSVFKAFAKDKKDYKTYKRKNGFKIVVNGLALGASITLTALAGWSGVGTVVGTIGMIRTASTIVQQIINLSKDSEDIYKRILVNVVKMRKQLSSPNLATNTFKESAKTVVNKVFAIEIETLVVTVSGIENDFALLGNKIKGNRVNTVKLSEAIPKMMDYQDKLKDDIETLLQLGVLTKKETARLQKLRKAEEDSQRALDALLVKVSTIREKVNEIEAWYEKYHLEIKALKGKYNPNVVKGVGLATDFLLSGAQFVGGNFADPAQTLKDLHDGAKVVVTSLALANDSIGTIKDLGTSMYDTFKG